MMMTSPRPMMNQEQIDKQLQYLMLEPEDVKKEFFNSLTRIQNLMSLDVMYINKADELKKKEHNIDLQSSQEMLLRERANAALAAVSEPKGELVTVSVKLPDRKQLDMNGNPI